MKRMPPRYESMNVYDPRVELEVVLGDLRKLPEDQRELASVQAEDNYKHELSDAISTGRFPIDEGIAILREFIYNTNPFRTIRQELERSKGGKL